MFNFTFHNPVKIYFGKDQIDALKEALTTKKRILLTYGQGSIKRNGIYDQVRAALSEHEVFDFGGIEPNPSYETLIKAIEIVRKEKIDFLLAVGGGSVIDGTKFIAAAANFDGEPWDILAKQTPFESALPFGCVLTLPAAGSEMNCGSVISRKSTKDKLFFINPLVFPQFAILDPVLTYSLSSKQTANGIIDAYIHVLEQYLTYPVNAPLQDRFAEGILLTLLAEAPKVMQNPNDYGARANIMWCATMALNNLIGMGVPQDWTTHMLGHEITAAFSLDHGQTLAIIMPSVMNIRRKQKEAKLLQYAERIFDINTGTVDERIDAAINKTRSFFESINTKTHFSDYGITVGTQNIVSLLVEQLRRHDLTALGERGDIDLSISEKIYFESL